MLVEEVRMEPVASLRLSERNPRRGDVEAIKRSLAANDQYTPIVTNRRMRRVLVGNHRLMAAIELGWTEMLVAWVDVDDDHAQRIMLADNRTSGLAGWDEAELAELLAELDDLEGTCFSTSDLNELLDRLGDVVVEDDDVPPAPAVARTQPGEVIELGRHRLVCGDARDDALVARMMAGDVAGCLVTDPPYGAEYEGKTPRRLRLKNDQRSVLSELLPAAFRVADDQLFGGAPVHVFHPTGAALAAFVDA